MSAEPRHDFYQTDTSVIVSVYVKGCKAEDVKCTIFETALDLSVSAPSPLASLRIDPLFSPVDASSSSSKVLGSKIEIKLQKAIVGQQWAQLKGSQDNGVQQIPLEAATAPVSSAKSAAPRPRSQWDSFKEVDENGKPVKEEEGVDDFFKQLYAGADDDTRRAMMKSYQESNGTALSTNWSEVGKKKVETSPPQGMEARKW